MASETKETVQTKSSSVKLEEWQRRNRRPLECIFNQIEGGKWACSIGVYTKAGVLIRCAAPTKAQAKEEAAKLFFELKADEVVMKETEPLPANTLKELCDQLSVPPCVFQQNAVSEKLLEAGHRAQLAAVSLQCAQEGTSKEERKKKIDDLDKELLATRKSSDSWMQCTITHPLWAPKTSVSALGRSIKEASRACEVRVLSKCMQEPGMFGAMIMPDSKSCQSAVRLLDDEDGPNSVVVVTRKELEELRLSTADKWKDTVAGGVIQALQSDMKLPLGIDCERVLETDYRAREKKSRVATIQVTNGKVIAIFQVHKLRETKDWPKQLLDLLNNPNQRRFGVDVEKDQSALAINSGAKLTNIEDLQKTASQFKEFGAKPSLAVMAARLCRLSLPKGADGVRTSNWSVETLSYEQRRYAALDALVTLLVGVALDRRKAAAATGEADPKMFLHPDRAASRKAGAASSEDQIKPKTE